MPNELGNYTVIFAVNSIPFEKHSDKSTFVRIQQLRRFVNVILAGHCARFGRREAEETRGG